MLLIRAPAQANEVLFWLLEQYLEALRRNAGIPGLAAAVVGENGILWERGLGVQDLEAAVATRPDTPFHIDGLTQVFTATLVLRCVEDGRLLLDDRIGRFDPATSDRESTVRQILTHTRVSPTGLVFVYERQRYGPLAAAVAACTGRSFRASLADVFERLGMVDSVPGPDALAADEPIDGATRARYRAVLERLAVPYRVDRRDHPVRAQYPAATLNAFEGVISTVRDLARLDLALRAGQLLRGETLAGAWQPPRTAAGLALPHGLGWFVQHYRGELVVWQFGVAEDAASALTITVPRRLLTFIVLANSDGLVAPFPVRAGDVSAVPVGRTFLELFIR